MSTLQTHFHALTTTGSGFSAPGRVAHWASSDRHPTSQAILDGYAALEAEAETRICEAERYCPTVRVRLGQDYALVAICVAHPLDDDSRIYQGIVMRPNGGRDLLIYMNGVARNLPRDWRRRQ